MLTSSLTVRRHSCRSIPRSTNPLPHYPLGSSSSNSFPHNPLSNPHLLNPVVSILYRNMRGGVGPALSSNPQFGSPPFIPFSFLIFHTMYWGHGLLAAPLESIRCALFPPRRGCVPCTHHFRSPPLLRRANPCAHTLLRAPAQEDTGSSRIVSWCSGGRRYSRTGEQETGTRRE
jgi:hypothetical protein